MEMPEEQGGCLETIFRLGFGVMMIVSLLVALIH